MVRSPGRRDRGSRGEPASATGANGSAPTSSGSGSRAARSSRRSARATRAPSTEDSRSMSARSRARRSSSRRVMSASSGGGATPARPTRKPPTATATIATTRPPWWSTSATALRPAARTMVPSRPTVAGATPRPSLGSAIEARGADFAGAPAASAVMTAISVPRQRSDGRPGAGARYPPSRAAPPDSLAAGQARCKAQP